MLDSSEILPKGLLATNIAATGNYRQCMKLSVASYCRLETFVKLPYQKMPGVLESFSLPKTNSSLINRMREIGHLLNYRNVSSALCVPRQCNASDIESMAIEAYSLLKINATPHVLSLDHYESATLDTATIVSILVFMLIILFNIIGSWSDKHSFWFVFNTRNNMHKLLFTRDDSSKSLVSVNFIKLTNLSMVVLFHSLFCHEKSLIV